MGQGQHSQRGALCPANKKADLKPKADLKLFSKRVELKGGGDLFFFFHSNADLNYMCRLNRHVEGGWVHVWPV